MERQQAKLPTGLIWRGETIHLKKLYKGVKIRGSTGTNKVKEAEEVLIHRMEEIRKQALLGVRRAISFDEAAAKYIKEKKKKSIEDDITHLTQLMPYIGSLELKDVCDDTLKPFVKHRQAQNIKSKSINNALSVVRGILNLSARSWRENGSTYLETAPLITMLQVDDARPPYPLDWDEQKLLFSHLSDHLAEMALFKVNTGTREQEVCDLQWKWEIQYPELNTSFFLIPEEYVKNGEERLVILNDIAKSIVESRRGKHPTHVFANKKGSKLESMNNTTWQRKRIDAALQAIKEDDNFLNYHEEVIREDDQSITVKIECRKRNNIIPYKLVFTTDDYDQWRIENGKEPMSPKRRLAKDVRSVIKYRAREIFIEAFWSEYEAFSNVRVHDLKHTFGRRLRAAGVPNETRKVLLGHTNGDITSHYSAAELGELLEAVNKVSDSGCRKTVALTVLKRKTG